jgi:hypothetical protein
LDQNQFVFLSLCQKVKEASLSLSKVRPRFCVYKTHPPVPPTQAPSRGVFVGKIVGYEIDQAKQLVSVVSSLCSSVPLTMECGHSGTFLFYPSPL